MLLLNASKFLRYIRLNFLKLLLSYFLHWKHSEYADAAAAVVVNEVSCSSRRRGTYRQSIPRITPDADWLRDVLHQPIDGRLSPRRARTAARTSRRVHAGADPREDASTASDGRQVVSDDSRSTRHEVSTVNITKITTVTPNLTLTGKIGGLEMAELLPICTMTSERSGDTQFKRILKWRDQCYLQHETGSRHFLSSEVPSLCYCQR